MLIVSQGLRNAIKLNGPAYKVAHRARIHPSTLSKLLCGIELLKPKDPRVVAVGNVLGIPEFECFEESD